jgi:predicted nuclease of predicted toxin-antitoxin system
VKLLFDENLSPKLVALLADDFPRSSHIELLKMRGATDRAIWRYAGDHEFIIVSKDNDFRQQVFLLGPPPKVIWLSVGNASTQAIAGLLKLSHRRIEAFVEHPGEGLLILELKNNV